jgi:hypothetical protein
LGIQWVLAGAAVLAAGLAWGRARQTAKRLDRVRESYWDLRYELGQLQARLNRLESGGTSTSTGPSPQKAGGAAFIPLSSLKR